MKGKYTSTRRLDSHIKIETIHQEELSLSSPLKDHVVHARDAALGTEVASGVPGTERGLLASIAGVGAVGGRLRGTWTNSFLGIRPLPCHERTMGRSALKPRWNPSSRTMTTASFRRL